MRPAPDPIPGPSRPPTSRPKDWLEDLIRTACVLEVTASKPGNVHLHASFDQTTWRDFIVSAQVISPILAQTAQRGIGSVILDAINATRQAVQTNTNLGIVLLLAPLCAVPADLPLTPDHVKTVLAQMTPRDARQVYQAISLVQPAGLGQVTQADVHGQAPDNLLNAMALAAPHDSIARQYAHGFTDILQRLAPALAERYRQDTELGLDTIIARVFVEQLAYEPDSLIARKAGLETARKVQQWAKQTPETDLQTLDGKLRDPDHRLNPGTTADLIAASLFVALRETWMAAPFRWTMPLDA